MIQLVSGLNSNVEGTLGGLRRAFVLTPEENGLRTGLQFHPLSKSLVLNSTPGFVQFYDTKTQALSSEVRVSATLLLQLFQPFPAVGCGWTEPCVPY